MRYEIKNGKNKTYYFKNELKEFGCQFKKLVNIQDIGI